MKLLSKIYKEQGLDFTFPIKIKDEDGNLIYFEGHHGAWKFEYDCKGYLRSIYDSKGRIFGMDDIFH